MDAILFTFETCLLELSHSGLYISQYSSCVLDGVCYRMEMNLEKTKVMRILRKPLPVKIMIDQKN